MITELRAMDDVAGGGDVLSLSNIISDGLPNFSIKPLTMTPPAASSIVRSLNSDSLLVGSATTLVSMDSRSATASLL
jgi:hypothetical protein